jgi:curved DNA-binding protein
VKYKDYYAVLGVPRDADADAISKAYRELARRHHADVAGGPDAEARFKEASSLTRTVSDCCAAYSSA